MNTKNGAVLWHCTEGKDRCGLLSATILFLLDVSEDDVMEDYLKTNKAAITRVEKLKKKLHLAGLHREKIEKIEGYFVAKEEFLNAALKTMKEEYGSINQFMIKGLNISMQQKEDFKQKVLEQTMEEKKRTIVMFGDSLTDYFPMEKLKDIDAQFINSGVAEIGRAHV